MERRAPFQGKLKFGLLAAFVLLVITKAASQDPDQKIKALMQDATKYREVFEAIKRDKELRRMNEDYISSFEAFDFGTGDERVGPSQVGDIEMGFGEHFLVRNGAAKSKLEQPTLWVLWASLDTAMRNFIQSPLGATAQDHGAEVIYGLDEEGGEWYFTYAIRPVALFPVNGQQRLWRRSGADYYHVVDGTGKVHRKANNVPWVPQSDYKQRMSLHRYHDNLASAPKVVEDFEPLFDTQTYLFRWQGELVNLYDDNDDKAERIQFRCSAEAEVHGSLGHHNIRHHLFAVMLDKDGNKLLEPHKAGEGPFWRQAANIGSPCPSLCDVAYFPEHGIPECKY